MEPINIVAVVSLALAYCLIYQSINVSVDDNSKRVQYFSKVTQNACALLLIGVAMYQYRYRISVLNEIDESNYPKLFAIVIHGVMFATAWYGPKIYNYLWPKEWADIIEESEKVKSDDDPTIPDSMGNSSNNR